MTKRKRLEVAVLSAFVAWFAVQVLILGWVGFAHVLITLFPVWFGCVVYEILDDGGAVT